MKVLVTGSQGFIGRNLIEALANIDGLTILTHTRHDSERELLKIRNNRLHISSCWSKSQQFKFRICESKCRIDKNDC